jgi:hypothetical protein
MYILYNINKNYRINKQKTMFKLFKSTEYIIILIFKVHSNYKYSILFNCRLHIYIRYVKFLYTILLMQKILLKYEKVILNFFY